MKPKPPLTLLILAILEDGPRHGYGIARAITTRSHDTLTAKEGTLYPLLHTLERQGLIHGAEHHEDGRTRRTYTLTPAGHAALNDQRHRWQQQVHAVNAVLGGTK